MGTTTETGHAKTVANFENLISFCAGYGAAYNPSNPDLQLPQLQLQLANAQANIASVLTTSVNYYNAVNARALAFEGLRKLSTRLVNALNATNASQETVKDAKGANAKVQGAKLTKADSGITVEQPETNAIVTDSPKTISSSQQSFSNLTEHFSKLITILSTESSYQPNENELQVGTLSTQLTDLNNKNSGVINAYTTVSNSRISRDQSLYNPVNGLSHIAKEVKMYIKSLYGATSPQYKQLSSLTFKARI